jgi:hypothetical protein
MRTSMPTRLNLRGIIWFVVIAYGLAWLLDLPIVLSRQGLASPWVALLTLQNFTPAGAQSTGSCRHQLRQRRWHQDPRSGRSRRTDGTLGCQ